VNKTITNLNLQATSLETDVVAAIAKALSVMYLGWVGYLSMNNTP
jgi:hypothetical protein